MKSGPQDLLNCDVMQLKSRRNLLPQQHLMEDRGFEPNSASDDRENTSDTSGHSGGTQSGTLGDKTAVDGLPGESANHGI